MLAVALFWGPRLVAAFAELLLLLCCFICGFLCCFICGCPIRLAILVGVGTACKECPSPRALGVVLDIGELRSDEIGDDLDPQIRVAFDDGCNKDVELDLSYLAKGVSGCREIYFAQFEFGLGCLSNHVPQNALR